MNKFKSDFGVRAWFGTLLIVGFIICVVYCLVERLMDALQIIVPAWVTMLTAMLAYYYGEKKSKE